MTNSISDLPTSKRLSRSSRNGCLLAAAVLSVAVSSPVCAAESPLVIEHCNVFDPESGKMLPDRTIIIRGTQIVSLAASDEISDVPLEATHIDGRGKYALPGWIDAHVHVVHVLDLASMTHLLSPREECFGPRAGDLIVHHFFKEIRR